MDYTTYMTYIIYMTYVIYMIYVINMTYITYMTSGDNSSYCHSAKSYPRSNSKVLKYM